MTNLSLIFTCIAGMSFYLNEERSAYRKWVNVLTSLLLPGSAHVLSGRVVAGASWFLADLVLGVCSATLLLFVLRNSPGSAALFFPIRIGFRILVAVDGCRIPIPRLHFAKWVGVALATIFLPVLGVATSWLLILRPLHIPTAAMEPTLMGDETTRNGQVLKEGDHVLAARFAYLFNKPKRGDVAIFKTDAINAKQRDMFRIPPDQLYVKRIVGLPGERVLVQPHSILINGQKLVEPKIFETLMAQTNVNPNAPVSYTIPSTEVQLGPDEYYVLGDNIMNGLDSRYYGAIKSGRFGGKVLLIFWPPERRRIVQ